MICLRLPVLFAITGFASVSIALAANNNACQVSSQDESAACQQSAQSDLSLALGMCENISNAQSQATCKAQAQSDYSSALKTCGAQSSARLSLCQKLGGGPYDPVINSANFVSKIDNPYLPMVPGTTFVYEGQTASGLEHNEVAVTHNTKVILGVTCIEVHDTVMINGVLTEDTLDWFAQDTAGNVWYFGENSNDLENGRVVSVEGSWTGGIDGAKPGIIMEAHPANGDTYRQEFLINVAEDWANVQSLTQTVSVPYGTFTNCLQTLEGSTLEPGALENKYYAPGIGNIETVDQTTGEVLQLIQIKTGQ
ncbi:MAG: hypothetical protein C5B51_21580 [Terriglobia bacterium]|nr:MAG: hypothetical protein C5B51_21580 [Terriglobia bacterium]